MNNKYVYPSLEKTAYNCPLCGAFAAQSHEKVHRYEISDGIVIDNESIFVTKCLHCREDYLWRGRTLLYPTLGLYPQPLEGMETDIPEVYKFYKEAGDVFNVSLKSSVFLLRFCLEKICKKLDASGNTLDQKIKDLEKKGFKDIIEQAELIRLIGNEGVHGQLDIDFEQNKEDVLLLFQLVNDIYDCVILQPRKRKETKEKYTKPKLDDTNKQSE